MRTDPDWLSFRPHVWVCFTCRSLCGHLASTAHFLPVRGNKQRVLSMLEHILNHVLDAAVTACLWELEWAFSPPAIVTLEDFLGHLSIVTLSRVCFTFSSRRGVFLIFLLVSLSFLLTESAWPLSSSENCCRLMVFCHWTQATHLSCAVRADFSSSL